MVVLVILIAVFAAAFIALGVWAVRSERDFDYTPTDQPDERLHNTARAAAMSTIGFIMGEQ